MSNLRAAAAPRRLPQFVGYREVSDAISVSRRTVERMVREGKFPPPVQLAPNRVGWDIEIVRSWLDERGRGLTAVAVSDPSKLSADDIEPTMRELGARLVAERIGEAVSPDQIRLVFDHPAPGSDISSSRAELLQQVEMLCGHFRYDRAIVIAASLFPAIREQLVNDFGLKWARDPGRVVASRVRQSGHDKASRHGGSSGKFTCIVAPVSGVNPVHLLALTVARCCSLRAP